MLVLILGVLYSTLHHNISEFDDQLKNIADIANAVEIDEIPYITLSIYGNYEKNEDYKAELLNEVSLNKMGLKVESYVKGVLPGCTQHNEFSGVLEVEGGYVSGFIGGKKNTSSSSPHSSIAPSLKKVNNIGQEQWTYSFNNDVVDVTLNHLKKLPNESILLLFTAKPLSNPIGYKNYIICVSNNGKLLWSHSFNQTSESMLKYLRVTDDNGVIAVGLCMNPAPLDSKKYTQRDIVITKINQKGEMVKQSIFGGSDYDNIHSIAYGKEFGLAIEGVTRSTDGDFANSKVNGITQFIARIDKSLNTVWCEVSSLENCDFDNIVISNANLFLTRHIANGENTIGIFERYDKNGKRTLSIERNLQNRFITTQAVLSNGDFIIGHANISSTLDIYTSQGILKKQIELEFSPSNIKSTIDGGFILKSFRGVKSLPQPAFSSSIWVDTSVLIEKYNSNYELECRKTYDKYHNDTKVDYVQPLPSGKVVIE